MVRELQDVSLSPNGRWLLVTFQYSRPLTTITIEGIPNVIARDVPVGVMQGWSLVRHDLQHDVVHHLDVESLNQAIVLDDGSALWSDYDGRTLFEWRHEVTRQPLPWNDERANHQLYLRPDARSTSKPLGDARAAHGSCGLRGAYSGS
jgi:hypothetical protein